MASPQFEKLRNLLLERRPAPSPVPVEKMRWGMESVALAAADDISVTQTTIAGLDVELITAPGADPERTLLYLHGGGYVMGSPLTHRKLAGELSRAAAARVVLPDYPLAPEHPFPAAIDAVTALYRALLDAGSSPARLSIGGDSAGGGLTAALLINLRDLALPLPAAGVLVSPWLDLVRADGFDPALVEGDPILTPYDMDRIRAWYLGDADPAQPLASPVLADLTGLPPLLIQVGGAEIIVGDSRELARRAQSAGVKVELEVWPDMFHVWHAFAGRVPEATDAVERIGSFLRDLTPPAVG